MDRMDTTSTASRSSAKNARGGGREADTVGSDVMSEILNDLQALRDDLASVALVGFLAAQWARESRERSD